MGVCLIFTTITIDNISVDRIGTSDDFDLISLYEQHIDADVVDSDSPFQFGNSSCNYYEPNEFRNLSIDAKDPLSFFHLNCRGLSANWESFYDLICDLHTPSFSYDVIGISEIYKYNGDTRLSLDGYHKLISRLGGKEPEVV